MNICLSYRLLIHLLAVLCLSNRLVTSQETDLLSAVAAADEVEAKKTTTDASTDSTTDGATTTDPLQSTTEGDSSTTESIVWTSVLPGNLSCVQNDKKTLCVLEGTEDLCDPCEGIFCSEDKGFTCLADNSTCTTECVCSDEMKTPNKDGVCTNPCEPSPCQNKQLCVLDVNLTSKFYCDCSTDYEGTYCEFVHNYCTEAHPAKCPLGAFECVFQGVGKYECSCAGGHTLDEETNTCTKVTQRMAVTLIFSDTLYMEAYNVEGNGNRTIALNAISGAMNELYGSLLISIAYDNFTQGSLVAHYSMDMRMAPDGNPQTNVYNLMKYITNCETDNKPKMQCFGEQLGKPHLPQNGAVSEDLRCVDVYCPVGTQCQTVDKSETSVRCSCQAGYSLNKTVVEDTGRQIDVCDDIDECVVDSPCKDGELCLNNPGSFECVGSPCDKNPCQGNAVCKAIDHYAYDCQCEWIYIASDCGTPWTLILVIVSSVLLALLILAIIGLIIMFTRSKKGSSVIDTTSF